MISSQARLVGIWMIPLIVGFSTGCGCSRPEPTARPTPTYGTPGSLVRVPIGTPSNTFWAIAKSVGCQMGSGKGPVGGFLANVDCEDGSRLGTVWDAKNCLKEIKLVWGARAKNEG